MRRRIQFRKLLPLIILFLVCIFLFSFIRFAELAILSKRMAAAEKTTIPNKTITRNGTDYYPRQDIDVYLLMGIDRYGTFEPEELRWHSDRADTVILVIFDHKDSTIRLLTLNRDTILHMPELDTNGKQIGTHYGHLTFAYYFGDGQTISCENTRKTVSDFLYGINIDHYVALTLDAVSLLNDAVGGVTVTVTDDFSAVGSDIPLGEVTLTGEQAIAYVQSRRGIGDHLNISRMDRQTAYMDAFMTAFRTSIKNDGQFALDIYNTISDHMITDCSGTVFTSALERYADYELVEVATPEGANAENTEYMEFYVDKAALDELILRLFYAEK